MVKNITLPMEESTRTALRAGDVVRLTGCIYTARDAAHKRLCALLQAGGVSPFPLKDCVIYYAGPCPARPGDPIGSCGPTTSGRMDAYAPILYAAGQQAAIGKGNLSQPVKDAMVKRKAVYFIATGGAGALIAQCVKKARIIAFDDLGAEAIREMWVEDLPAIVGVDSTGADLYEIGRSQWEKK